MIYSKHGLAMTESFEGCKLIAYQDSKGVWTIGYGHINGVYEGMTCSKAEAEMWLIANVQNAEAAVNRLVA